MKRDGRIVILHLITTLYFGGAEMMLFKLLSNIDNERFKNHVICLKGMGAIGEKILRQKVPVHVLNMPSGRPTVSGMYKLWRLLRSIRPDVLQTWLYHADLLGLIFGTLAGIEHICWNIRCSDIDLSKYPLTTRITLKLCVLVAFFPKVIVTNSLSGRNFHRKLGYKAKRWEVVPNGFDLERFKPNEQAKRRLLKELEIEEYGKKRKERRPVNERIIIGYVARYHPMKDHVTFIHAARTLLQKNGNVHFVLIGRNVDWKNNLLSKDIPHDVRGNFHLLGERDDIEKIMPGLDIACSVSFGEGFPNVVGEAMASGVPCVVTDVGDSAFVIGNTGLVVPPNDPETLANAWEKLIKSGRGKRSELGKAARNRVMDHFELSYIAKKYERLYSDLVNNG
jgi:glycosyltransferase involved in cell wall biosynthesis